MDFLSIAGAVKSPHDRLRLGLVDDVLREALQELGVLALVDDAQRGCRGPAAGVDDRTVGDLGRQLDGKEQGPIL
jgi:hypothetical protein